MAYQQIQIMIKWHKINDRIYTEIQIRFANASRGGQTPGYELNWNGDLNWLIWIDSDWSFIIVTPLVTFKMTISWKSLF